jgi:serine/threonine-protein kinase
MSEATPPNGASPDKTSQQKQKASFGQVLGAAFNSLTALVDRLLGAIGISAKPGVSAWIVCALVILLCGSLGYVVPAMLFGSPSRQVNSRVALRNVEMTTNPVDKESGPKPSNNPIGNQNNPRPAESQKKEPIDSSKSDREQSSHLNDQYEVGGEGKSGFGAIAYSPATRSWGEAYGYTSRNAAERRALQECASAGDKAKDCRAAASFYRQCGAVVDDDKGNYGVALGATAQLAVRDAFANCAANNGKDCEIERVTCTR